MIDTISGLTIGVIVRAVKITASTPGSYGAYVDLSNMEAGDEVAFWLEYDIGKQDAPVVSGDPLQRISYEDIVRIYDEGGPNEETFLVAGYALEPVTLELNQVSQLAFAQTAGVPKDFDVRNTKMEDGT